MPIYRDIVEYSNHQKILHSNAQKAMNCKLLKFISVLESSNIYQAKACNSHCYSILIHPDTNNNSSKQWFYFGVTSTTKGQRVTFQILNFSKKSSLYTQNMKIAIKSQKTDNRWTLGGENISYFKTEEYIPSDTSNKVLYTLLFEYEFECNDDTVYFSYAQPYPYSDLLSYLHRTEVLY